MPIDPASEREEVERSVREGLEAVRDSNLGDVLSEESRRYKRAVLALSLVAAIISKYELDIKEIPWLSIPAPEHAKGLMPTLVLVALAYHVIGFVLHAWADIRRWMLEQSGSQWTAQANVIYAMNKHLNELKQIIEKQKGAIPLLVAQYGEIALNTGIEVLDHAARQYRSLSDSVVRIHRLKRLVAWTWDFILPLAAAGVGIACLVATLRMHWFPPVPS